jgi:hypothetical protein
MRKILAVLAALGLIYVSGPVAWKEYNGCWYLPVAAVNFAGPSGVCVTKEQYDAQPVPGWFSGWGYQKYKGNW